MPRHRVHIPLRWSDADAYGHINNVQFLRLLEDARVTALGVDLLDHARRPDGGALMVSRQEIEYLAPLAFRIPPIGIDLWVTRIGAADFELAYEVLDGEPGAETVCARAETTLFSFDLDGGRPRRIDTATREKLTGWIDGPLNWKRRRREPQAAR
ncbi:acyl-CoA thioesterase [Kineosporia sp. J2-2]|uniref:Acyl-CoA thioesterase n=1 Tax=Kineosporia corallincola TaxID=2835133 RepID=A0ABS5TMA5_9ACTN|nr:thioesterase family protein [Kineosporia corallincola]MBT0772230.1 acyl-CoA thioesterase [Kineosporia corallincola]